MFSASSWLACVRVCEGTNVWQGPMTTSELLASVHGVEPPVSVIIASRRVFVGLSASQVVWVHRKLRLFAQT